MYCFKTTLCLAVALLLGAAGANARIVHIPTRNTSLVVNARQGEALEFVYYGERLSDTDLQSILSAHPKRPAAYPVYGIRPENEAAMSVVHPDGNMTLDMVVAEVREGVRNADGTLLTSIRLTDRHYPFDITVNYRTYPHGDVIGTWVEAVNRDRKKEVRLTRFASACLPVRYGNVHLTQFYGAWANETRIDEGPLRHGVVEIKNKDGVRNSQTAHAEIMLSLDGRPSEHSGRTIGAALCYSGNYRIRIDTDNGIHHRLFAGINEDNSEYRLQAGETFVTPELALTYSAEGKGGVSRNFHRWARNHKIAHGNTPRKILLNSWEGVYFDINEEGMQQMMTDIAGMGGELFVMDDGWFGGKYPRNNGSSSLGDWVVDTRKLPHGIGGLLDAAERRGIKFGIWIEPEMANTVSELYAQHPEYILKAAHRDPVQGRGGTQVVLDLANPEVQEIVFRVVDTLLTRYPTIDYIKWDANAPVMNHGSQYLPADRQSHLYIEYHRGLAKTLDRIRAKYPDVTIQACASGGGRANYGLLPWFDEVWVSDNTDALQRVYMQWGTSHFFPSIVMGSHISAAPNHQTHRTIPLKYRIDVAMSGRLGMEIQPKNMTDDEKALCRNAIAQYKEVREVIQLGDLYRLLSPYDRAGAASLMYVTENKEEAVYFWWKTESFHGQQLPRIPMSGLDPDKRYKVTELNRIDKTPLRYEAKVFTGRYLLANGLEMPADHNIDHRNEYASRVLRLEAVE